MMPMNGNDNLMKRYIKPVARKAGIHKNIDGILSVTPSARY